MSPSRECRFVVDYLEHFGEGRRDDIDHDRVTGHVNDCPGCYERMTQFFRVMEVPDGRAEYLRETLDDLTFALYNLAKALVRLRDRAEASDPRSDNVRFVSEPGEASEYAREGAEMIDDVQDFTGQDQLDGASMDGLRDLLDESQRQFDLVMSLVNNAIDLKGHYSLDCLNLKGILLLSEDRLEDAEVCFVAVIKSKRGDLYTRTVQVHAMNNLSFLCNVQNRLDEAIQWAQRSRALAEETAIDTFSSSFGLMYFYLRRNATGDHERAIEEVERIMAREAAQRDFRTCIQLPTNAEIRNLFERSGLARQFSSLCD